MQIIKSQQEPAWLEIELTMAQARALIAICRASAIHGRGLAHALGISQSAASKLIDHLVEANYAQREEDPTDRRVIWVRPTEEGLALYYRLTVSSREALIHILETLSPDELNIVTRGWEILAQAAERLSEPGCYATEEIGNN